MTARRRSDEVGLVPVADTSQAVSSEQIDRRAFAPDAARAGVEGSASEDWLGAERELRSEGGFGPGAEEPPSESDGRR
jgi:hypothetical protein